MRVLANEIRVDVMFTFNEFMLNISPERSIANRKNTLNKSE